MSSADTARNRDLPQAVLFACSFNAVRSPMAAAIMHHLFGRQVYVESAGVREGALDPFAVEIMEEIGIDISRYHPKTFEFLADTSFDLIVSLSPEAHHKALEVTRSAAVEVEYWPVVDPTAVEGARSQRLDAYREVRDAILARIHARFGQPGMAGL
jgi:protein-tyrosine-phosphatase